MWQRVLASVILLFSVLFMPFWVSAILGLAGMVYFRTFWEAVILFLLSDALYGAPVARFGGMVFVSFTTALVLLIVIEIIKKKLRLYGLGNI